MEPVVPVVPSLAKLYRAGTLFNNHFGHDGVVVYWYRRDRDAVYLPYEKIIAGHDAMTRQERRLAKNFIDQLLTHDEVVALRHYLTRLSGNDRILAAEEVSLPTVVDFSSILTAAGDANGIVDPGPDDRGCGHIYLYNTPGYDLPFRVIGSYRHPMLVPYAVALNVNGKSVAAGT